jgi:hypothetical protein
MYGLAYVIIPARFESLQAELDQTLAPFRRGGEDVFPRERLAFDDATKDLRLLHGARFRYNPDGSLRWLAGDAAASYDLSLTALSEHMKACRLDSFEGTFAEIEPDFDTFVQRFTRYARVDAATGRYGRWLNPIGYWDWWELGGRFNGASTGERRPAGAEPTISSGPSPGRAILGNVVRALGGQPSPERSEIEMNVELVESLKGAGERLESRGLPTAVVLPLGACVDEDRWFDRVGWHKIRPGTREFLGAAEDADFAALLRAAYAKFPDHAAALQEAHRASAGRRT